MGGDHVAGQNVRQRLAQLVGVRFPALSSHHIGHEPLVAGRILAVDHGDVGHLGMCRERSLDLSKLDAEAADLDLVVPAAEELEVAVGQPARQIASAVEARLSGRIERVGDETFGGQLRTVEIAAWPRRRHRSRSRRHADGTGCPCLSRT